MRTLWLGAMLLVPSFCRAAANAAPDLSASFAAVQEALPRVSMRYVRACFEREDDARADALGLPKRFCLDRVGTRLPAGDTTPFDDRGSALVEGSPASGAKHISGGVRRADGGWDINADLFSAPEHPAGRPTACGQLNMAFAAVYFSVDFGGRTIDGPVAVRGFLMDGATLCPDSAKSVSFEYRRLP
jgi:hypothetical protein